MTTGAGLARLIENAVGAHLSQSAGAFERCKSASADAARRMTRSLALGGRILVCGNGGSAADAQHFAAELVGRYARPRAGVPATSLAVDPSIVSALANDFGYESVFARQVEALGRAGDVLLGITTSGTSANVVAALKVAKSRGMTTVLLTSERAPQQAVDVMIRAPGANTALVQQAHLAIEHAICDAIDAVVHAHPGLVEARVGSPAISDLQTLVAERDGWAEAGVTVVTTNGVFDMFHAGHLHSLTWASQRADVLIVGVNSDASTRSNKGPGRPIVGEDERMSVVAALGVVSRVVRLDDTDPVAFVEAIRPDVHVKGAEYANVANAEMPERAVVQAYGGRVDYVPRLDGWSTSARLKRLGRE